LAVMIAIGTMISLGYYLRVVATVWMSPADESEAAAASIDTAALPPQIAGAQADPFTDSRADRRWYLVAPALIAMAAALFFGVIPQPLVDFAQHAGNALSVWIS
ncbi:MAG TPA: hypothetical protein PKD47_08485, partial [Solirubrobacterales bacterium]|nr:hypothetical protein [Solirubrobacterales bacterium]